MHKTAFVTPMERVFLAIIKCLTSLKTLIFNHKIKIITDNKNLLFDSKDGTSKVQSWKMTLSEYDYELSYRKGSENIAADIISKINTIKPALEPQKEMHHISNAHNSLTQPIEKRIGIIIKIIHENYEHPEVFYSTRP